MLKVDSLTTPLFGPVSLEVPAGGCVGLMGPSGAGKSLLLRAIADLDPSEGRIELDGVERGAVPAPAWRRQVTCVPATSGWWAPDVRGHFGSGSEGVNDLLAAVGLPKALDWEVARLSTGERQRLSIARALAVRPQFLLLDEPTAALDPTATGMVETLLQQTREQGTGLLLVTHDAAQADRLCDRVFLMTHGQLEERGGANE